jgi:hypothetical protein
MIEYRLPVGVVMRRRELDNRWASESWEAVEIVPDEPRDDSIPRPASATGMEGHWLHPGFTLELFRDEAENYYLNVSAAEPCVFVMWRMEDGAAVPKIATLSYGEAARMMDANEQVDNVPMPPVIRAWLEEFVRLHYRPEPKKEKRMRPPSFNGARRSDP